MLSLTKIGYSKKPKGITGEIRLSIEEKYKESLGLARALFFDINGSKVPYLIEEVEIASQCLVKLDEVDHPEAAQILVSCPVYLEDKEITIEELDLKSSNEFSIFVGYQVIDQNGKTLGKITDVVEYPSQIMAEIECDSKNLLWPLHKDNIVEVEQSNQILRLDLPEGIEDLFK